MKEGIRGGNTVCEDKEPQEAQGREANMVFMQTNKASEAGGGRLGEK